jgi:hypothetical protein
MRRRRAENQVPPLFAFQEQDVLKLTINTRTSWPWVTTALTVAGLWNLGGAALLLAFPNVLLPLAFPGSSAQATGMAQFHITSLWLFVGLVGAALLLATRAPRDFRGVMLLSAVGRVAFAGLILIYWFRGDLSLLMALAGLGEVALAACLLWAYRQTGGHQG